jgi:hypothetical protein
MRMIGCLAALLACGLAGCASEKAAREAELAELVADLPGRYVSASAEQPGMLTVLPVRAGLIGERLFYLEWSANGGAAERRLVSIEIVDKKQIVQRGFEFVDPPRWRAALQSPELFLALVPEDLRSIGRCNLKLTEKATALDYACGGANIPLRRAR